MKIYLKHSLITDFFYNFTLCCLFSIVPAVLALILVITYHAGGTTADEDTLFKCLQDSDYDYLLKLTDHGLPPAKNPKHVVIVGAGAAGLTAAKFLEDAGHKVS